MDLIKKLIFNLPPGQTRQDILCGRGLEGELRGEGEWQMQVPQSLYNDWAPAPAQHSTPPHQAGSPWAHPTPRPRDRGSKPLNPPALPWSSTAHPSFCSANPIPTVLFRCPHRPLSPPCSGQLGPSSQAAVLIRLQSYYIAACPPAVANPVKHPVNLPVLSSVPMGTGRGVASGWALLS